jgi:hypothetical protein
LSLIQRESRGGRESYLERKYSETVSANEVRRQSADALHKVSTSETLAKLIQLPEIDIYDPAIFSLARTLAIRFSKEKLPFIPVYPELVAHKQ